MISISKMKVLLINVNQEKIRIAAPIGICYIAEAVTSSGNDVELVDLCFEKHIRRKIAETVKEFKPDIIGLSIRNIDTYKYQNTLKYIKMTVDTCKSLSDTCVILGGAAVSVMPEEILRYLECDYAIIGDGEKTFIEIINKIKQNNSFLGVDGLAYFVDGEFTLNCLNRNEKFSRLNICDWIDFNPYKKLGAAMPIQSKRGCALNCIYCVYGNIEGRNYRLRSPVDVADEIENLIKKTGADFFEFVDSTFNIPQKHAEEICRELISRKLKVKFTTAGINPLGISSTLFKLMKDAGFNSIHITPETASEKMLHNLKKGFTIDYLKRSAEYINESGLICVWSFMLGGPGETADTIKETLEFAKKYLKSKKTIAFFEIGVRIYPNTELERIAKSEGYISKDCNLLYPTFYISPRIDKNKIIRIINEEIKSHPNFVLGYEQTSGVFNEYFQLFCNLLRLSPPYWQYALRFLSLPLVSVIRHYRIRRVEKRILRCQL